MAIKIQTIKEAIGDSGIKIIVFGPAGSGKTVLLTTIVKLIAKQGGRLLIVSAEAGLLSVQNIPDDLAKLIDVIVVESIDDVNELYANLVNPESPHPYTWICVDSISEIAEVLLAREKAINSDPRKSYVAMADEMFSIIRKFRDLPGVNVAMSSKEQRFTDDNGVNTYGPMMPGNQLRQGTAYLFDEVFALHAVPVQQPDGTTVVERRLQTGYGMFRDCKDRSGTLDMWEYPDLSYIASKINGTNDFGPPPAAVIDQPVTQGEPRTEPTATEEDAA